MGSERVEDQRRHRALKSQNGRLKARSESQEKHRIALDGEDWYDVRHGRLIITPDGTAEEEESVGLKLSLQDRLTNYICISRPKWPYRTD